MSNPTIISALLNLLQSGNIVGGFPGSTLNLPGGSPYGYAPSNGSYCLFSTVPNNSSSNSTSGPKALGESPANFTCVEGTTAGPGQIPLTINGTAYVCSAPSATTGRKLLQGATAPAPATLASLLTPQTADLFFNSLLNAVSHLISLFDATFILSALPVSLLLQGQTSRLSLILSSSKSGCRKRFWQYIV